MLAEFFDRLKATVLDSERPQILQHQLLPHDRTFVSFKGKLEQINRVAPDLKAQVEGLDSFVTCASGYEPSAAPAIFVSPSEVVCCHDEAGFDRTHMRLRLTGQWGILSTLGQRDFTQAEAVRLIRFELHGVGAEALLAAIRTLDFVKLQQAGGIVQHGKESLGRSIESSVKDADRVPEQFLASVPIFLNGGLRDLVANVKVGVYLDVAKQRIQLAPLADQCASAFDTALEQVRSRIAQQLETATVVLGSPE